MHLVYLVREMVHQQQNTGSSYTLNIDYVNAIFDTLSLYELCTLVSACKALQESSRHFLKEKCKELLTNIINESDGNQRVSSIYETLSNGSSDAVKLSNTCEKFQELAGIYFHAKYKDLVSKQIIITEDETTKEVYFDERERYVKLFSRHIENVRISYCKNNKRLIQFMQANCSKNIRKIGLIHGSWSTWFSKKIAPYLQAAEVVEIEFSAAWNATKTVDDILRLCPQMKCLKISYDYMEGVSTAIRFPAAAYPQLEMFTFSADDGNDSSRPVENLEIFFANNPNIKRIVMDLYEHSIGFAKQFLRAVSEHGQVEELFIWLHYFNYTMCLNGLKKLNDRNSFKRLELKMHQQYQEQSLAMDLLPLSSLTKLSGLYLSGWNVNSHLGVILDSFAHLKVLQLEHCFLTEAASVVLTKNAPELKELHFINMPIQAIQPFLRNTKVLSKIIVYCCSDTGEDMSTLINERMQLEGACKTTIYLDENPLSVADEDPPSDDNTKSETNKEGEKVLIRVLDNVTNQDRIELKRAEIRNSFAFEDWHVPEPFIFYSAEEFLSFDSFLDGFAAYVVGPKNN